MSEQIVHGIVKSRLCDIDRHVLSNDVVYRRVRALPRLPRPGPSPVDFHNQYRGWRATDEIPPDGRKGCTALKLSNDNCTADEFGGFDEKNEGGWAWCC